MQPTQPPAPEAAGLQARVPDFPELSPGRGADGSEPKSLDRLLDVTVTVTAELGRILAEKVNGYKTPVTVLLPKKGISVISAAGGEFYDEAADEALFSAIKRNLKSGISLVEIDSNINDEPYSSACARALLENMREGQR